MNAIYKNFRAQHPLKQAADIIALIVIIAGIAVSIFMNSVGRSLWVDEAMLAFSFSQRSLANLTRGILEWEQSAPVLYLYITKICTIILGNTEAVLRSVSIASYIATIALTVYICHSIFNVRFGLQAGAFLANMNFLLTYSNMFKQYMSECVWVLLVIVVYSLYRRERLKWYQLMAACMIFIWGANPACFFMGGMLVNEFIEGIVYKTRERSVNSIKIGIGIGVSFVIYYLYWLKGAALSTGLQEYWQNSSFPLIPRSVADIQMARAMIYEIFITFREARLFMLALAVGALVIGFIWERDRYVRVIGIGFVVALFGSFIHMFPIADRLWCFSFPLFTILAFYAIDRMSRGSTRAMIGALALICALISSNNGIAVYRRAENVYMDGEEANIPIAYVTDNVKEGEEVYIYRSSVPVVGFKIGYNATKIGNVENDNLIWGTDTPNKEEARGDIERVTDSEGCYIIASHAPAERIGPLYEACRERGFLFTVINEHETPLYYYTKNPDRIPASASIELIDREDEDDTCYATLRVTNTGSCIINAEGDGVILAGEGRDDVGTNLWGNLMPGDYFDMPVYFEWKGDDRVSIALRQGERLSYGEITIER